MSSSLGERLRMIRVEGFSARMALSTLNRSARHPLPGPGARSKRGGDLLPAELLLRFVELTKADPDLADHRGR